MFLQLLSSLRKAPAPPQAKEYLISLPESCLSAGFNPPPGCIRAILTQTAEGINPSTRLNSAQQKVVKDNLQRSFLRYFSTRDQIGEENAAFHRDMNLLKVVTFINTISPCSSSLLSITRATRVGKVFDGFTQVPTNEPLISYQVDPERFSNAILSELSRSIHPSAALSREQESYLRRLLKATIEKSLNEVYEIGVESALTRQSEWLLLISIFCGVCTGR